jgi:shikimate kinase
LKKRSGNAAGVKPRTRVPPKRAQEVASGSPRNAVFLVGFMGAGKSSVGRALGQQLNWVFEDLDDRIERREGRSIAEIFGNSGEAEFRRAEHSALVQLLEELRGGGARIVALGGGAFVARENAALLQAAGLPTIFLDAAVDELWQRCCMQANETGAERPLLRSRQQFRELYQARRKSYCQASTTLPTGGRSVDAIAAEIVERLALKRIAIRQEQGEVE